MPASTAHFRLRLVFAPSLILLLACLLPACATHSARPRGNALGLTRYDSSVLGSDPNVEVFASGPSLQSEPDEEGLEQARKAEAERALDVLWAVVSTTNSLQAEWEFQFWSHDGALTLLSLRQTDKGKEHAAPLSRGSFLPRLASELPTLLGLQPQEFTLALEREETGWSVDLDTSSQDLAPVQARAIPSTSKGASQETYRQALNLVQRMARLMSVPRGGSARLEVQVVMKDGRIVGWEPGELDSSGDGPGLSAPQEAITTVLGALLPFTRGLGERTVSLTLRGEHRQGEAHPRWLLVEARTLEPPPPPMEVADFNKEYRALHESILVEFQEQSREYAVLAAGFTLEQIAYAVVGGLLINRALVLIEVAAPTITSTLARGGKGAVRWFRNVVVRASSEDRALLQRLWMKAETQGLKAFTEIEKQELRELMGRLENLLSTPLDRRAKQRLWEWSRKEYFELHNPQLAKMLGAEGVKSYQVHHICPMEYAHLFPKLDINGKANLAGLHRSLHESINTVWSSMRDLSNPLKPQDIEQGIAIVNRHYGRWFNTIYDAKDAAALVAAERAALSEMAHLKALLAP